MIDLEKLIVKVQDQMKAYNNVFLSVDDAASLLVLLRPLAAGTHVIVPVIATGDMLVATEDALCGVACGDLAHDIAGDVYHAMLAAGKYALSAGKYVIVDAQREFICRECHLRIEEGKPASTDF
jgi:hypothetical protein